MMFISVEFYSELILLNTAYCLALPQSFRPVLTRHQHFSSTEDRFTKDAALYSTSALDRKFLLPSTGSSKPASELLPPIPHEAAEKPPQSGIVA